MSGSKVMTSVLACGLLAACGGGGSGVGSTPPPPVATPTPSPTPTPTPTPAPTNSDIGNLVADESFATLASSSDFELALSDANVTTTGLASRNLTIAFDADSNSFTVSVPGTSQTFGPADIDQSVNIPNITFYAAGDNDASQFLTITTQPAFIDSPNRYAALGYWQRNVLGGGQQDTLFDTFIFGFPTAPASVPVVGLASYYVDIFGAFTLAGEEARAIAGAGNLELDFETGTWRVRTTLGEYPLATRDFISGGTLVFNADGFVTSGSGLDGVFTYTNADNQVVSGEVQGGFYGPAAQEVGAVFSGDTGTGAVLNGGILGQLDTSAQVETLALTNIQGETIVSGYLAEAMGTVQSDLNPAFRGFYGNTYTDRPFTRVQYTENGTINVLLADSLRVSITPDELVSSEGAYDVYETMTVRNDPADEVPVTARFFKTGAENPEVQLTYASFGILEQENTGPNFIQMVRQYFTYGFATPEGHLNLRSGTASYSGIAVGSTTDDVGTVLDVDGTSLFVVDFGADTYSGELDLQADNGGTAVDLGTFGFASTITNGIMDAANFAYPTALSESLQSLNTIIPVFYGPDGSEIVAPFSILLGEPNSIGASTITGVAVATED